MNPANNPSAHDCYLTVTPLGVLMLLVGEAPEVARRLCRALLRRPANQRWVASELPVLMPGAGRDAAQALYGLMTHGAVELVTTMPFDDLQPTYPVSVDLERLVHDGAEAVLLLDDAGRLLAHAGLRQQQAQLWASELAGGMVVNAQGAALGLRLDDGYDAVSCTLVLRDSRAAVGPALVPLVRRLVRARTHA